MGAEISSGQVRGVVVKLSPASIGFTAMVFALGHVLGGRSRGGAGSPIAGGVASASGPQVETFVIEVVAAA